MTRSNSKLPFSLTGEKAAVSRKVLRGSAGGSTEVASLEVDSARGRDAGIEEEANTEGTGAI